MYSLGQQYVANGCLQRQPVITTASIPQKGSIHIVQQQQQQVGTGKQQQQQQLGQSVGTLLRQYEDQLEEGLRAAPAIGVEDEELGSQQQKQQ